MPTPLQDGEPVVASATQQLMRAAHELAGIADELGLPKLGRSITADTERRLRDGRLRVVVLGETLRPGEAGWVILVLAVTVMIAAAAALARGEAATREPV